MSSNPKKKVFVHDSHNSTQIKTILQELYGDDAEVFCDEDDERNLPPTFDLFFFSGMEILERKIRPLKQKENSGNPGAKVVAISVAQTYLEEIKNNQTFGVDFVHNKNELIASRKADDLSEEEKEKLGGYLLA